MYLIVGLGNPESDYSNTRHNMGFDVINKLAKKHEIELSRSKFDGIYGTGIIENEKVILLKPQTYMNLSGDSLIQFKDFYKIPNDKIIVIYDDIDIDPGIIRIRQKGSPGTHNGVKSVVHRLNSDEFLRVRVGIGKPDENMDLVSHVIGFISEEDKKTLTDGIMKATEAIEEILKNGVMSAMNKFN
jgi:PTH1 family peptidyl-tRNA hydrolase